MAKLKLTELAFKRLFRERLKRNKVWTEAFEPTFGSSSGVADIAVQFDQLCVVDQELPAGHIFVKPIVFVELKVGELLPDGKLLVTKIRPAQYSWKRELQQNGGQCFTVVGVPIALSKPPFVSAFVLPNFNQIRFMKFVKDGVIEKDEYINWPSYECTKSNYIALCEWERTSHKKIPA